MPESESHVKLVEAMVRWIANTYFAGDAGSILVDSGTSNGKPPRIDGYVPDAFATSFSGNRIVIGEAKTWRDLENRHTHDQIVAFMRRCRASTGGVLVLAVPWHMTRFAASLLRSLKKRHACEPVDTVVIEKLEG
jgi:hypothetical protein